MLPEVEAVQVVGGINEVSVSEDVSVFGLKACDNRVNEVIDSLQRLDTRAVKLIDVVDLSAVK